MKSAIDRKELKDLLLACGAIAVIPAAVLFTRPRPLSASSLEGLTKAAFTARQQTILTEMQQHTAISLDFDKPDAVPDFNARWRWVENELEEAGATRQQATSIARVARGQLHLYWPVLVERGYLRGHRVWLIIGARKHNGGTAWICPPSPEELRQERIERLCSDLNAAAISVDSPHQAQQ